MRLDGICWRIAGKMLGVPGTLVERTGPTFGNVIKGKIYKVSSSKCEGMNLKLEGVGASHTMYAAEYFKKAVAKKD